MAVSESALEQAMYAATGFVERDPPQGVAFWPGRRLFRSVARGVAAGLVGVAVVTTTDSGFAATGPASGVGAGLSSMVADRMAADLLARLGWNGPRTADLCHGVAAGFVSHVSAAAVVQTTHAQVGQGTGQVLPGGVQADASAMEAAMTAAFAEDFGWQATPKGIELFGAVAEAVAAELALATGTVTISGPFNPLAPSSGQGTGTIT